MEILVIILFLLIALLLLKFSVIIKADNKDIAIYLSVLFLRFSLYPEKRKKEKPKSDKQVKAKKDNVAEESKEKKKKKLSFSDFKKILNIAVNLLKKVVPAFFKAIKIDRCKIKAVVGGSDAADTAIKFGQLNALVSSLYALLLNANLSKNIDISINCDFLYSKSSYYADIKLSIRVWRAVAVALKAGLALLPMLNKKENVYD